jgi:exodeoxyribonuclease VII large subunit
VNVNVRKFLMNEFITVSELNNFISSILEGEPGLHGFWLKGEISGYKLYQQSGHMYFTLKDQESSVSCVMFKSRFGIWGFKPEDGMEVLLRGSVSVFARQGKYQDMPRRCSPRVGGLFLYLGKTKSQAGAEGALPPKKRNRYPGW